MSSSGGLLTVDLGALAANWLLLRDRAQSECAAVVKANAYGTGIEPAVRALWAVGCRTFFVAHLSEAARVRAELPAAIVYVLNGLLPGAASAFSAIDARPVLGSRPEIAEWTAAGGMKPAALHVDTGMNRLGLSFDEAISMADGGSVPGLNLCLLMSHFVAAEDFAAAITSEQITRFAHIRSAFAGVPSSLANSSGLFLTERPADDLARPGYALFGGNPTPGAPNPMHAVVRLEAPIVQVRDVAAGDTVGYNARWTAPGPMRIATLSLGYGDGYPRAAGGTDQARSSGIDTGAALVGGRLCPFVGRVSMDLAVIDVSDVPAGEVERGAMAVLIGDGLEVDEVGRRAGTIGYEVLTALGTRFERRYVNG